MLEATEVVVVVVDHLLKGRHDNCVSIMCLFDEIDGCLQDTPSKTGAGMGNNAHACAKERHAPESRAGVAKASPASSRMEKQ